MNSKHLLHSCMSVGHTAVRAWSYFGLIGMVWTFSERPCHATASQRLCDTCGRCSQNKAHKNCVQCNQFISGALCEQNKREEVPLGCILGSFCPVSVEYKKATLNMCRFVTQHNATECNWHADCRNVHPLISLS
jgi:hypothetical protein